MLRQRLLVSRQCVSSTQADRRMPTMQSDENNVPTMLRQRLLVSTQGLIKHASNSREDANKAIK